jgi:hypothetical protein
VVYDESLGVLDVGVDRVAEGDELDYTIRFIRGSRNI